MGRGLSNQRFIRPINAPLAPAAWALVQSERARHGFAWERLPEEVYLHTAHSADRLWQRTLVPGQLTTVKVSCHIKAKLAEPEGAGSFLLRPKPPGPRPRPRKKRSQSAARHSAR